MGIKLGKANRPFTFVAATAAFLLVISATASFASRGESDQHVAVAAQSSSPYPQSRPPAGFQSKFAEVNGFRMHYVRGGEGSPVVMIHGFPENWSEWRQQMTPLAKNHTVIAVDMRGYGESQVTAGGYDAAQSAKDAHQLLMQLAITWTPLFSPSPRRGTSACSSCPLLKSSSAATNGSSSRT